jgi:acetyltransferase-like isoleucine patch superfamily enzyme
MNAALLLRRLLGRPTCSAHASAQLHRSARIINIGGHDDLIRIGAHSVIRGELLVFAHGGAIEIGDWCYIGEGTRIWSGSRVRVGRRVMIAHNVNIFDNLTHPLLPEQRHAHFRAITTAGHPRDIDLGDRPVVIEDDAWIGAGAMVLRGVTVGYGAVVAAGAVLTHDLEPLCIAAGNPARVVRRLEASPPSAHGQLPTSANG